MYYITSKQDEDVEDKTEPDTLHESMKRSILRALVLDDATETNEENVRTEAPTASVPPYRNLTLITVLSKSQNNFFQSFFVCTAGHPITITQLTSGSNSSNLSS